MFVCRGAKPTPNKFEVGTPVLKRNVGAELDSVLVIYGRRGRLPGTGKKHKVIK